MTENNNITMIATAKIISGLLNPFMIPFVGFLVLFLFSYLRIMPFQYKLIVLGIVYSFTVLMPLISIYLFRRSNGWESGDENSRRKVLIPYLLTIIAYLFCFGLMYRLNIPHYMSGIILAALVGIIIGCLVSIKWKISEHMIGMGEVVGGVVAFGILFHYNPLWWLCILILISGILGTSRIILGQYTLGQVLTGFLVGFCCAILGILYL